jgi:hypothetical protein
MGLWQPFGVGSTASRPKSRGSVFKHEFLGILSTWHDIFGFILLPRYNSLQILFFFKDKVFLI